MIMGAKLNVTVYKIQSSPNQSLGTAFTGWNNEYYRLSYTMCIQKHNILTIIWTIKMH